MSFNTTNFDWLIPSVGADRNTWGRLLNNFIANDPSGQSLDSYLFQLTNTNAGATAPTYPTNLVAGRQWLDTSDPAQYVLKIRGNGGWAAMGVLNTTTNNYSVLGSTLVIGQILMWAGWDTPPSYWLKCDGTEYLRTSYPTLFGTLTFSQNCTTVNGSPIITGLTDTSNMFVNMQVQVNGITGYAQIASIDSATQITLNQNVTATQVSTPMRFLPYGGGSDTNHFTVPNFVGKTAKGAGTYTDPNFGAVEYKIGQAGGVDYTFDIIDHTHEQPNGSNSSSGGNGYVATLNGAGAAIGTSGAVRVGYFQYTGSVRNTPPATAAVPVNGPVDIRNPYQVVNSYIIFAGPETI